MDKGKKQSTDKGISVKRISAWVFIVVNLFIFVAVYSVYELVILNGNMLEHTGEFVAYGRSIEAIDVSSDYLTDEARSYVVTGDLSHIDNYIREIEVIRGRDKAYELIDTYSYTLTQEQKEYFLTAKEYCLELEDFEIHAIRLVVEANEVDVTLLPARVAQYQLSYDEELLSDVGKKNRALNMLYSDEYTYTKTEIEKRMHEFFEATSEGIYEEQASVSESHKMVLKLFIAMVVGLFIVLFLATLLINEKLIRPVIRFTEAIDHGVSLPVMGSREMRKLAITFNEMYAEKRDVTWVSKKDENS